MATKTNKQDRKFAVVTGASSGIGLELARVFADNGFDLLVTSGSNKIERAANELRGIAPHRDQI